MNQKKLSVQQNTLLNSFGSLFYLGSSQYWLSGSAQWRTAAT